MRSIIANLTPTIEASGPHDFAVRKITLSSAAPLASIASQPYVRDDRETPLRVGRDGNDVEVIWVKREREYFCEEDWTPQIRLRLKENFPPPRTGRATQVARRRGHLYYYWPGPLLAASACSILFAISALSASRLKLAPRCIGGYSRKVWISLPITCWTNTKRQNWYLNQSKYCCPPSFVPLFGQPVRSNGSRRRLVM